MNHPYKDLEDTVIWNLIGEAIEDLVVNGDLEERTARPYIVGYIARKLSLAQTNKLLPDFGKHHIKTTGEIEQKR